MASKMDIIKFSYPNGDVLHLGTLAGIEFEYAEGDLVKIVATTDDINTALENYYTESEADAKFVIKGEDAYDDEQVRGLIQENADAIAAEAERAAGVEAGLRSDVDAIKGDYLKAVDKNALQEQITANANSITALTNGIDPDKIDGLTDLVNWANEHAPEVESIKADIEANEKAINDETGRADAAEKALAGRLDVLEAIDHDAYKAADTALHTTISAEIDADVKAAIDAEVVRANAAYDATGSAEVAKDAAIADAASKYETKGTAQGIVDGLKLAETYEPIGAENRAIAVAKTETENQIAALGIADYAKTTDVEATYRRKDVAITPEDLSKEVVFIFNCGTATTVI